MPTSPALRRCRSRRSDRLNDRRGTMIEARTPRRWRARLAVVTVVAGLFTTGVVATAPAVTASSATKAQPPKVAQLGKYAVGLRTETFVDSTRPTENVAATRTLKTAIYYPAQGTPTDTPIANAPPDTKNAPYPLILFSHGLGARGVAYENVLKAWASAGYVVAAPDYPLSNTDAPGGAQFGRGIADGTVPYAADMNGFARAKTPKYFLTFLGAGHVTPFLGGDNPSAMALKQSTIDFFNRYLKDDKAALDKLRTDANVQGASSLEEHPESTATARAPTSTTKKSTTPSS